jgi:hypothetical protein
MAISTLYEKLKKYNVQEDGERPAPAASDPSSEAVTDIR